MGNPTEHFYFVTRNICSNISYISYVHHYNLIKLECDWHKFVDSLNDTNRFYLDQPTSGSIKNIYELDFKLKSPPLSNNRDIYKVVAKNVFKNFKIRTLSLTNLGIESVDRDAFEKKTLEDHLESLDLSGNNLKRLDSRTLMALKRLEKLNISNNKISLESGNFKHNKYLTVLDVSSNQIQFLAPGVFSNVNILKMVNLSNNELRYISECVLMDIQVHPISSKYAPALIDLTKNPIECDCALFYLNRVNNYKINAQCSNPIEYKNKNFIDLKREDPSMLCTYSRMKERCLSTEKNSGLLIAMIILSCFSIFLTLISCCCCCKLVSLNSRFDTFKTTVRQIASRQTSPPRPNYVNASIINDREKLIK